MNRILDWNTVKLLRIPFSFFLMPVYFLALNQSTVDDEETHFNSILIFIILHLFIYPASNGYNSFMDKDEGSIGGLKNPPMPTQQLFYVSLVFDAIGLVLSWFINIYFFIGVLIYSLVSRAYSWKGIRLKKYAIPGFLSVVIFQGAFMFLTIYVGINQAEPMDVLDSGLIYPMLASSFMIAGGYPLTQIYQHQEDKAHGDKTLSLLLGYNGTFIFSSLMFMVAGGILFDYLSFVEFVIFEIYLAPLLIFFMYWAIKVFQDTSEANYENTMRMNILSSACMNACFITIFILNRFT